MSMQIHRSLRRGNEGRFVAAAGLIAVAACLCWTQTIWSAPIDEVVRTTGGPIQGKVVADGIRAYLGVPYAAPPIGDLRWRPPRTHQPWQEVRDATALGPSCPQPDISMLRGLDSQDEDCLTLNVWTAAADTAEGLPVMVWIHGGGYYLGGSAEPTYDGTELARAGVVLVSVNYRLGTFGFLAHPALTAESRDGASGMYGIMDQILALQWVRDNISGFGGDPERVTIFGQSAGAGSVCCLMTSRLARGLFHRAILHSGRAGAELRDRSKDLPRLESMESLGVAFAERLGVADAPDLLAAMRAKPWQEILDAFEMPSRNAGGGTKAHLSVDGHVLTEAPGLSFAKGGQARVPLMAGTAAREGSLFTRGNRVVGSLDTWQQLVRMTFGPSLSARVLELYPAHDDVSAPAAYTDLVGDYFVWGARDAVRQMAKVQPKTWLYQFTHVSPRGVRNGLGSYHGCELPYAFGNLAEAEASSAEDKALSRAMIGYWIRFAASGDPNGEGAVPWAAYTERQDNHLILDTEIRTGRKLRQQQLDLLGERLRRRR
jgi:para-nitrobenzyl esterase